MSNSNLKVYGLHSIIEAINAGKTLEKVYLKKGLNNSKLNSLLNSNNIAISYVPEEKLNRLSKFNNHQGAVAIISPISFYTLEEICDTDPDQVKTYLILDGITDVRNFGAIARTAACTNVSAIIIPHQGSAPINADAIKTSAGALYKIPICKVAHIKDAIYHLQSNNVKIIAATEKAEALVYKKDLTQSIAIVMGSEGKGINPSVLKIVDEQVKLPMLGEIDSLNVAVACSVLLYESVRQKLE